MSPQQQSLKPFNTLKLDAKAAFLVITETIQQLLDAFNVSRQRNEPFLVLGEGSNVLFLEDYSGTVVVNRLKGIEVSEDKENWHLHVAAGENWHALVEFTLNNGYAGLENMALIPGSVGAAPVQNIGAYGAELKDFCDYVDVLDLRQGQVRRMDATACRFGYRDSVFKHHYRHGYVIVAVGIKLPKAWQPVAVYGELKKLNVNGITPRQIFDSVCRLRRSKLPDPAITGNAGSFFKNPLIDAGQALSLQQTYPDIPVYPQPGGEVKLAAGWLIDRCQLKGYAINNAAVHQNQALVLINKGKATANDIVALARLARNRVGEKFNVWLEPEVRFIGATGEKNAVEVIG